jgi:excisionase family DNA binding protein
MNDLLTVKEVAKLLRLSAQTLYKMLEQGEIPAMRIGKQWRFEASVVKNWLESQGSASATDTANAAAVIPHANTPVGASID